MRQIIFPFPQSSCTSSCKVLLQSSRSSQIKGVNAHNTKFEWEQRALSRVQASSGLRPHDLLSPCQSRQMPNKHRLFYVYPYSTPLHILYIRATSPALPLDLHRQGPFTISQDLGLLWQPAEVRKVLCRSLQDSKAPAYRNRRWGHIICLRSWSEIEGRLHLKHPTSSQWTRSKTSDKIRVPCVESHGLGCFISGGVAAGQRGLPRVPKCILPHGIPTHAVHPHPPPPLIHAEGVRTCLYEGVPHGQVLCHSNLKHTSWLQQPSALGPGPTAADRSPEEGHTHWMG